MRERKMGLISIKSKTRRFVGAGAPQRWQQYSRFDITLDLLRLSRVTGDKILQVQKIKPRFLAADSAREMIWLRLLRL